MSNEYEEEEIEEVEVDEEEEEEEEDPNDLPPPYYEPVTPRPEPEVVKFEEDAKTATAVDPEIARAALLKHIDESHCCWGTGPAKECKIETNFWASIVCRQETFVEFRNTAYAYRPYNKHGAPISKAGSAQSPLPWDMSCPPPVYFQDSVTKYDVPYTSTIKKCDKCKGRQRIKCTNCDGRGDIKCRSCGGDGKKSRAVDGEIREETCHDCRGRGRRDCEFRDCRNKECKKGKICCPRCRGYGKLEKYLEMSRHLETIVNSKTVDFIPDEELHPDVIAKAPGKIILNATAYNILPPSGFSPDVDSALVAIDQQGQSDIASRHAFMHQERLEIKSVPVSKAEATVDGSSFHFWVYGSDNRCLCKEEWGYPSQCCCGCVIC